METRSEKSAAAIVAAGMERRAKREGVFYAMSMCEALRQMPERSGRVPLADGEAGRASASDEATRPRHETGSTGSALLMAALTRDNPRQLREAALRQRASGIGGFVLPYLFQVLEPIRVAPADRS